MSTFERWWATVGATLAFARRFLQAAWPGRRFRKPLTRWQIVAGFAAVSFMALATGTGGVLLWCEAIPSTSCGFTQALEYVHLSWVGNLFPAMAQETWTSIFGLAAGVGGLSAAGIYSFLREFASKYDGAVHYLSQPGVNEYREDTLILARALQKTGKYDKLHLVGYSFGALIAIDTIFAPRPAQPRSGDTPFATLTTIGSVFDFVKAYWPEYFVDRAEPESPVRWLNIFSNDDVLGSEIDLADLQAGVPDADLSTLIEQQQYTVASRGIGWASVLFQRAWRVHGNYWTARQGTSGAWYPAARHGFAREHASPVQASRGGAQ